MKIIIISLNCVIDTHYYFENFSLNKENFSEKKHSFPGGKGVNVAKVLKTLNCNYSLFLLLGKENSKEYESLLGNCGIEFVPTYCNSRTRENISIHADNIDETRICSNYFYADDNDCFTVFEKAKNAVECGDIVVFSGRLPTGISKEKISSKLSSLREKGCCLIVDSASFLYEDYKTIKPFLIKPNEDEILLFDKNENKAIEKLLDTGIENIALSKGAKGIELYRKDKIIKAIPPEIKPLSTVGAGDSSVAGFAFALANNFSIENAVRFSVACGSACCLTKGGEAPKNDDIQSIYNKINCI